MDLPLELKEYSCLFKNVMEALRVALSSALVNADIQPYHQFNCWQLLDSCTTFLQLHSPYSIYEISETYLWLLS